MTEPIEPETTMISRPKKIMKKSNKTYEAPASELSSSLGSVVPDKEESNTIDLPAATMTKNRSKTHNNPVSDYNPYEIRNRFLVYHDPKSEKPYVIGRMIVIKSILKNIDTGELLIVLEFDTVDGTKIMEFSRGKLTKQKITELLTYGADVMEHQIKPVLIHLNYQERNAEVELIHDRVGWDKLNGNTIFKLAQAVGCASTYRGKLMITPKGTLEQWMTIIEEQVMGNTPRGSSLLQRT